jgi:hypothetical protein
MVATYGKIGFSGLLVIAVIAFFREWIIPGTTVIKMLAEKDVQIAQLKLEKDEFKQLAIRSISVAEQTQRVRGGGFVGSTVNGVDRRESA